VKKFQFKFKYFPENVADEVIQDPVQAGEVHLS
jgi:uncharacterized protein with ACT and thioredoxin-like domain